MKEIFLDAASNTAVDSVVFKAMKPYLKENFIGNSRSIHDFGVKASQVIEKHRNIMSSVLQVPTTNIVFTSGATEGNNTVIKALAYNELVKPESERRNHIICSKTEHDSVINPCKQLEKIGFKVDYIEPNSHGKIELESITEKVTNKTFLICVMSINNELGVENNIPLITRYAKRKNIFSLVDCTQTVSYGGRYMQLGRRYPDASFMTFSGHKIYGPEGTGCLIATGDNINVLKNSGLIVGGAQEYGIRGGTSNVAGIVGITTAAKIIHNTGNLLAFYYRDLYNYLLLSLRNNFQDKVRLNTKPDHKNIISLNFGKYIGDTDSLAADLANEGIGVSASSACDSQHDEFNGDFNPSHVLSSLKLTEHEIRTTIRVSFNKKTTCRDIDMLIKAIKRVHDRIQNLEDMGK